MSIRGVAKYTSGLPGYPAKSQCFVGLLNGQQFIIGAPPRKRAFRNYKLRYFFFRISEINKFIDQVGTCPSRGRKWKFIGRDQLSNFI